MINIRLLKTKMAYNELSIQLLANKIGVSRDTISRVLNNSTLPSYRLLYGFYIALNLTPEEFIEIFFDEKITH